MGTYVVVKVIQGHKIDQQRPSRISFSVQNGIVAKYATNLNRNRESWRNLSTRESGL